MGDNVVVESYNKTLLENFLNEIRFMLYATASLRFIQGLLSVLFDLNTFSLYQFTAAVIYALIGFFIKSNSVILCYLFALLEVSVYAIITALHLGYTCSADLHIIVFVPISCMILFMPNSKIVKFVFLFSSLVYCILSYLFIDAMAWKIFPQLAEVVYTDRTYLIQTTFSAFHIVTEFLLLFIIMMFFVREIRGDVAKLKWEKKELVHDASLDPLTELYNRRKMMQIITTSILHWTVNKMPFTIAIGDIDFFKRVNDTYGHQAGDFILKNMADSFKRFFSHGEVVCRWGGEEFLFLLPMPEEEAILLLDRLREEIKTKELNYHMQQIFVTMTFGVSQIKEGIEIAELIEAADHSLYYGKKHGRDCVVGNLTEIKEIE